MNEMQLDLFQMPVQANGFQVGEAVAVNPRETDNVEDHYYYQEYAGVLGHISKIIESNLYEVVYKNKKWPGIFSGDELRRVS